MCLKRANWRQYILSVLLLIIVLASNSSQQKLFSSPRPFQRFSKVVGTDEDGFMPMAVPTAYKPLTKQTEYQAVDTPLATTVATQNDEPLTELKSTAKVAANRRFNTDVTANTNEREAIRSINHSIQELQEMTLDFLTIIKQNNGIQKRAADQQRNFITDYLFNDEVINRVKKFTEKYIFQAASGSALQNIVPAGGRLFFFKGMSNLALINEKPTKII